MSSQCPTCEAEYSDPTSLKQHMKQCCPEELAECPTCDELLLSDTGVKMHHVRTHGESLLKDTFECDYCGETNHRNPAKIRGKDKLYCDNECRGKDERVDIPKSELYELYWGEHLTTKGTANECGVTYSVVENRMREHGIPMVASTNRHAAWIFHMMTYEWKCNEYVSRGKSTYQIAEENNVDQGWVRRHFHDIGIPIRNSKFRTDKRLVKQEYDYGPEWQSIRKERLALDDHTCQGCGVADTWFHVHHVTPFRMFEDRDEANRLENLVTLCVNCHNKWEGVPVKPSLSNFGVVSQSG